MQGQQLLLPNRQFSESMYSSWFYHLLCLVEQCIWFRIRHLSKAALETIQRVTYAFAARGYRPRRYLRLRPRRHPANRGRAREPSLLAPKNKNVTTTGNLRPYRWMYKGKNLPENAK